MTQSKDFEFGIKTRSNKKLITCPTATNISLINTQKQKLEQFATTLNTNRSNNINIAGGRSPILRSPILKLDKSGPYDKFRNSLVPSLDNKNLMTYKTKILFNKSKLLIDVKDPVTEVKRVPVRNNESEIKSILNLTHKISPNDSLDLNLTNDNASNDISTKNLSIQQNFKPNHLIFKRFKPGNLIYQSSDIPFTQIKSSLKARLRKHSKKNSTTVLLRFLDETENKIKLVKKESIVLMLSHGLHRQRNRKIIKKFAIKYNEKQGFGILKLFKELNKCYPLIIFTNVLQSVFNNAKKKSWISIKIYLLQKFGYVSKVMDISIIRTLSFITLENNYRQKILEQALEILRVNNRVSKDQEKLLCYRKHFKQWKLMYHFKNKMKKLFLWTKRIAFKKMKEKIIFAKVEIFSDTVECIIQKKIFEYNWSRLKTNILDLEIMRKINKVYLKKKKQEILEKIMKKYEISKICFRLLQTHTETTINRERLSSKFSNNYSHDRPTYKKNKYIFDDDIPDKEGLRTYFLTKNYNNLNAGNSPNENKCRSDMEIYYANKKDKLKIPKGNTINSNFNDSKNLTHNNSNISNNKNLAANQDFNINLPLAVEEIMDKYSSRKSYSGRQKSCSNNSNNKNFKILSARSNNNAEKPQNRSLSNNKIGENIKKQKSYTPNIKLKKLEEIEQHIGGTSSSKKGFVNLYEQKDQCESIPSENTIKKRNTKSSYIKSLTTKFKNGFEQKRDLSKGNFDSLVESKTKELLRSQENFDSKNYNEETSNTKQSKYFDRIAKYGSSCYDTKN